LLLSAFFWTYAPGQIPAGWLADRFDVRTVYAVAFALWCSATLATSFMSTFAGLLFLRLLLGAGEAVVYPATSHIFAGTVPEERRGMANAIIDVGARLGPAVGTFGGALVVSHGGWRLLFLITGGCGIAWLVPWLAYRSRIPVPDKLERRERIKWEALLRRRALWGTIGGICGANYAWYFILNWMPLYLVHSRHLSMSSMAIWGSIPYVLMAASSLGGGILADWLVIRKMPLVLVRKTFLASGLVATAALLPVVLFPRVGVALAGLLSSCFVYGIYASNLYALTQALAGPRIAGWWTGIQNACGNLAGLISAIVSGWIIERTGSFAIAFLLASGTCIIGAGSFWLLVRETGYKEPELSREF
jgi:predicted MFS family arabinose efflux permease